MQRTRKPKKLAPGVQMLESMREAAMEKSMSIQQPMGKDTQSTINSSNSLVTNFLKRIFLNKQL